MTMAKTKHKLRYTVSSVANVPNQNITLNRNGLAYSEAREYIQTCPTDKYTVQHVVPKCTCGWRGRPERALKDARVTARLHKRLAKHLQDVKKAATELEEHWMVRQLRDASAEYAARDPYTKRRLVLPKPIRTSPHDRAVTESALRQAEEETEYILRMSHRPY